MKILTLYIIRFYQLCISPFLAPRCRFYPTCSEYSYLAIKKYGFFKGLFLSLLRLSKCHPFHKGGFDPLK